jgi:glycosyltransferase involved in cell wall biosynthesis
MALYNPSGWFSAFQRKVTFDIVSTHFSLPSGPLGYWLARQNRTQNVLTIYGADIYDPTRFSPKDNRFLKRLNEYLLNSASVLVAESSDIRNNAQRYYDVKQPISIIPLPYSSIDFPNIPREAMGLRSDRQYIISVGRLVKRKGYAYLIEAIARLNNPLVELLVIGDGPEMSSLWQLAQKLGVADRIHFLGYQPEIRKFQYLANADLYVLSSEHEGFGIVLQEAMQVGLPIVSTNVGGQIDFLKEGHNALLVPPCDPSALVQAIGRLLNDNVLCEHMRRNNRKDVSCFDVNTVCEQYLSIFRSVLNGQQ